MKYMSETLEESSRISSSTEDDWCALYASDLPVEEVLQWANQSSCGAVVLFTGNARDHAPERPNVSELAFEAYEEQALPRMQEIVDQARLKWPEVKRLGLLHRTGKVEIGGTAVVVVASSPHRPEAFEAARFCIDVLKATVPIWKYEKWDGNENWGVDTQNIVTASDLPTNGNTTDLV
tara:strand:+ start:695 stop:1228 length:534 start_codon:yes stop_codon:yes gene_type:complete